MENSADPYAAISLAVKFVDVFLRRNPQGVDVIADMRNMGIPPAVALAGIKELADVCADDAAVEAFRVSARAEMDYPLFATYVNGLLGAV